MKVHAHSQIATATRAAGRDTQHLCCRVFQYAVSIGKSLRNHYAGFTGMEPGCDQCFAPRAIGTMHQRYQCAFCHLAGLFRAFERLHAKLLELAIQMRALQPRTLCNPGHTAAFANQVMLEISALERVARFAQRQLE